MDQFLFWVNLINLSLFAIYFCFPSRKLRVVTHFISWINNNKQTPLSESNRAMAVHHESWSTTQKYIFFFFFIPFYQICPQFRVISSNTCIKQKSLLAVNQPKAMLTNNWHHESKIYNVGSKIMHTHWRTKTKRLRAVHLKRAICCWTWILQIHIIF